MAFIPALAFRQQNVVALIDGSRTKIPACALSTVTGIPLLRLHGDSRSLNGCEKAVQMSAGYRDYAHATLDILNTFHWEKIALVFDGKLKHVPQFITLNAVIVLLLYLFFLLFLNQKVPFPTVLSFKIQNTLPGFLAVLKNVLKQLMQRFKRLTYICPRLGYTFRPVVN